MISLIDGIKVGDEIVTDSVSVVMKPGSESVTISVERLPVTVRFDTTVVGPRQLHIQSDDAAIAFIIAGTAQGPFGFDAPNVARTDDGRLLSISFFIEEVVGVRGPTRVVHCTVMGGANGAL